MTHPTGGFLLRKSPSGSFPTPGLGHSLSHQHVSQEQDSSSFSHKTPWNGYVGSCTTAFGLIFKASDSMSPFKTSKGKSQIVLSKWMFSLP